MSPIGMSVLLVVALGAFSAVILRRLKPLRAAKPAPGRFKNLPGRVWSLIIYGFLQKRMVDDLVPGLLHIFVFFGFCAVSLRTVTLVGRGFSPAFELPGFGGALGHGYLWAKDLFEVFVIVGVIGFFWRRLVSRPKRLTFSTEGLVILGMILTLMVTDFLYDGALIATGQETNVHAPVGTLVAKLLSNSSSVRLLGTLSYWIHVIVVFAFLNLLPLGKHFHVITSLPNVFLRRLDEPKGHLSKLNLEDENAATYGLATLKDLNWKQMVDLYTCTECGRCTNVCPANATGKPLSPKQISINLRETLNAGKFDEKLPGQVIDAESLWSCTTCRACEEACPVFIEYVDRIVDMRRELVLTESAFPPEMAAAFNGIERSGNPWNIAKDDRTKWTEGLKVAEMADAPGEIDYLFWVGCAGAYDDRNKKVSRSLAKLMDAAGVRFAILGREESCTGDPARRAGNEYLFQMAAQGNVETFKKYAGKIRKVVTACPHCFNTLKNEYPDFGLENVEVIHHSQLISDLVASGRLKPGAGGQEKVVFHDPCYLGRYNDQYGAPRNAIDAVPGVTRIEIEQSGRNSRCCGAGGARMFMEEKIGTRMNENRLKDLTAASPDTIAVGCPFCMTMINDAVKQKDLGEKIRVRDIAEVLADRIGAAKS